MNTNQLNETMNKADTPVRILTLFIALISVKFACAEGNHSAIFKQANDKYAKADYQNAIELYESILEENVESGELYFNLGNAYYKNKQLGLAILNYEKAKKYLPGDEDIETNLAIANLKTEDKIESENPLSFGTFLYKIVNLNNEKNWSIIGIIALCLSLFLYALYFISGSVQMQKLYFYSACCILLISLFNLLMAQQRYSTSTNQREAIIIAPVTTITSAPTAKSTKLFLLHEGAKVSVNKENETYIEIKFNSEKVGWVLKKDIRHI